MVMVYLFRVKSKPKEPLRMVFWKVLASLYLRTTLNTLETSLKDNSSTEKYCFLTAMKCLMEISKMESLKAKAFILTIKAVNTMDNGLTGFCREKLLF